MSSTIQQKSDYTFKANRNLGRHGWLRLTPAYGVKLVEKLLTSVDRESIILDPFSGTATTGLVAAEQGYQALTFDINPFLIWLGNAKYRNYDEYCLIDVLKKIKLAFKEYKSLISQNNWTPQIFNIERWWSSYTLKILAALRISLVNQFGEPEENENYDLVWIGFCRLIIETSSAAFNHISMSFNDTTMYQNSEGIEEIFVEIIKFMLPLRQQKIQIVLNGSLKKQ